MPNYEYNQILYYTNVFFKLYKGQSLWDQKLEMNLVL